MDYLTEDGLEFVDDGVLERGALVGSRWRGVGQA
jgi:hypothetical protein